MKWYAVMTKCRKEDFAEKNLKQQGFTTFYPHYIEWTTPKKTKPKVVKRPHLTRYIFVGLGDGGNQSFYTVNNTYGVYTVVYCGYDALPIPDGLISSLMENADPDGRMYRDSKEKPPFPGTKGDRIRFREGSPLFGFIGELQRVDKGGRLMVQLDKILGLGRQVSIDRSDVSEIIPRDGAPRLP